MGEPTSRAGSRLLNRPPAGHGATATAASTAQASAEQQGTQANTGQGERGDRQKRRSASAEKQHRKAKDKTTKQKNSDRLATPRDPFLHPPHSPQTPPVQMRAEPHAEDRSEPRDHMQCSLSPRRALPNGSAQPTLRGPSERDARGHRQRPRPGPLRKCRHYCCAACGGNGGAATGWLSERCSVSSSDGRSR